MRRPVTKGRMPPPPSRLGTGKPRMPRLQNPNMPRDSQPSLPPSRPVTKGRMPPPPSRFGTGKPRMPRFEEGGAVKGEKLDDSLEDFANKARSRMPLKPRTTKKSDMPMVDQYAVDRKMGRFSGSYKEYLDAKEAKTFKKGGSARKKPPGLYANIHAKKKRIAAGSGEKMRKVGSKGAPTKAAFIKSAKTAKKG